MYVRGIEAMHAVFTGALVAGQQYALRGLGGGVSDVESTKQLHMAQCTQGFRAVLPRARVVSAWWAWCWRTAVRGWLGLWEGVIRASRLCVRCVPYAQDVGGCYRFTPLWPDNRDGCAVGAQRFSPCIGRLESGVCYVYLSTYVYV